ncbi:MAG: putative DNA-binding domain-containing protein [Candidatus Competibacteraceae bacterium]|nr:putative DNA-binding domain-containing protein [Candidatus Competibacteraceae bacterium]
MRLADLQRRLGRCLLEGRSDPAVLERLADPPEQRERRLAVYRNNVRHALLSVLEAAFPVVRQLVGAECFAATMLAFVARHPPGQPVLYRYGDRLPDFLADFSPLAEPWPWLPDVARLEWARNEALFAPEAEPLTPARLAAVPPADLPGWRPSLHPSARLLGSIWPVHAIWDAHQPEGGALEAVELDQAESVLVWRQAGTVRQRPLQPGEWALLIALAAKRPLAQAVEAAAGQDANFDFPVALARLLGAAVLVAPNPESGGHELGDAPDDHFVVRRPVADREERRR